MKAPKLNHNPNTHGLQSLISHSINVVQPSPSRILTIPKITQLLLLLRGYLFTGLLLDRQKGYSVISKEYLFKVNSLLLSNQPHEGLV